MEYNSEIGKIYDCIYFGIVYFYQRGFLDGVSPFARDVLAAAALASNTNFDFYDEVNRDKLELPRSLYPFFYYDGKDPCLLTEYFNTFLDYDNEGFDEFLETLKNKPCILKTAKKQMLKDIEKERREFLIKDENEEEFFAEIGTLDMPDKIKRYYLCLFDDFDRVTGELIRYLRTVYPLICRLHDKYNPLKEMVVRFNPPDSKIIIGHFKEPPSLKRDRMVFTLCLLNEHIICLLFFEKCGFFILGRKAMDIINSKNWYANANVRTCMAALGNETRHAIMEALRKNKFLTASQLSRLLDIPVSTVHEGLETLWNEGMIEPLRITAREIYFVVNGKYFDAIHKKQNQFIKQYLSKNLKHGQYSLNGNEHR